MVMSILTRKLLRTIQATRGQFLALMVIVTLGVILYIGMTTSYYNLSRSQQQFTRIMVLQITLFK